MCVEKITTVFAENIPKQAGIGWLWKAFGNYGSIKEVYLAKKLSRRGFRFAFIRFFNELDATNSIRRLQSKRFNNQKMVLNISMFNKNSRVAEVGIEEREKIEGDSKAGIRCRGEINHKIHSRLENSTLCFSTISRDWEELARKMHG